MKALREYLLAYLRHHPVKEGLNLANLIEKWPLLVGEYLSERLVPVAFEKGVLVCQVSFSALIQELQFLESDILAKLQNFDSNIKITKLKFVASAPYRKQHKSELSVIEKAHQQRKFNYQIQSDKTLETRPEQFEKQTEKISDPQLRQQTHKLFAAIERRQKQLEAQKWKICYQCHTYYEPGYKQCPYCPQNGVDN